MAWVSNGYNYKKRKMEMSIIPYKTDMDIFQVVKTRQPQTCMECRKKIPSKSYVYGSGWTRLCLSSGSKFSRKGIKKFQEIIEIIKQLQKIQKQNKQKWEDENLVANL